MMDINTKRVTYDKWRNELVNHYCDKYNISPYNAICDRCEGHGVITDDLDNTYTNEWICDCDDDECDLNNCDDCCGKGINIPKTNYEQCNQDDYSEYDDYDDIDISKNAYDLCFQYDTKKISPE